MAFPQQNVPTLTSRSSMKANILINGDRRACIADFGLSTVTGVATRTAAGTSRTSLVSDDTLMSFIGGGTRRWMSPELLDPEMFGMPESEDNRPTRQSDCYALGMVIYEVGIHSIEPPIMNSRPAIPLDLVWTSPLPRDTVRHPSCPCHHGRGSTEETGGGETTRIHQRTVEDC